jgi:hypothetical protein
LPEEVAAEFRRLADAILNPDVESLILAKRRTVPAKVTDGMVIYADSTLGTTLGSGEGYYGYYAAGWNYLG